MNTEQLKKIEAGNGFIAALDQSGGSTPKALKLYGVDESAYSNDGEMFDRMHEMRTRIITSPAFTGDRILGAILFEMTMDRTIQGKGSAEYLWQDKSVVPFVKVDKGLAARGRRRAGDEADARSRRPAHPGQDARRVRHQDALGDQAGQHFRRRGRRRASSSRWAGRFSPPA